ncbi:hypothetical protein Trydic_g9012 [Trypoxylus dichotomus]
MWKFGFLFLVILFAIAPNITSIQLPDYMKKCGLKDPELNKCIIEHANDAIPVLVKGDDILGIPILSPVIIPKIDLYDGDFRLDLSNVTFDNFKDFIMTDIHFDIKEKESDFVLKSKYMKFAAKYAIKDGQILTRSISGNGKFLMTLVNNTIRYKVNVATYEKNGEKHIRRSNPELKLESERGFYYFENILSVDEGMEDVNIYLQEHWEEVQRKTQPGIEKFILKYIELVLSAVNDNVPVKEIFL